MQRGQSELVGGNWIRPGMEGQRHRGQGYVLLFGDKTVGDTHCSMRCFWSRDEPASGLVPLGGFLGKPGKRKPHLGIVESLRGRIQARVY